MNPNLGPCEQAAPDQLSNGDVTVGAACYRLAVDEQTSFQIFVDRHSQDDITTRIIQQCYSYPAGFGLLPELAPPGGRVLDLGGHIGTFALYASASGYAVTTVEASPANAMLLQASLTRNDFTQLRLLQAAISDRTETLEFVAAGPYGVVANPFVHDATITVQAHPVADLLAEVGWERVDFIKLDIEGSEVKALRGMSDLLAQVDAPPILFESNGFTLNMFGETPNTLLGALEALGYHCYLVQAPGLTPVRASDFQPACNVDYLATKQPPSALKHWQLTAPLSRQERNTKIAAATLADHPNERAYIGRALARADKSLLADRTVWQALAALQHDENADVRAAAAWWQPSLLARAFIALQKRWHGLRAAST